ncbi:MAG: ATP-binding cassette domain-containing protein, partial [Kordiimonadaceae bacterium]|nr:ATP-binding cassette domain-containing protein [Kordiimonadaceae bacterium]
SGGQQQRVSLCRAMMLNPPLLLLDEPFSALDPITKSYIHAEFEKLQKAEARTILLVTHDMEEAVKLAENIVVIQNGKIIQHGKTEDIINAPFNSYVEELLSGITS